MNTFYGASSHNSISTVVKTEILIKDSPAMARAKRLKRSVITTARVIQESLTSSGQRFKVAMVTLTYRNDDEWRPNHISAYLDHVRKWAARGGATVVKKGRRKKNTQVFAPFALRYVYVAELTQRGRVHYHVLFWLPRGITMPMADRQGWWKHGMTKSEWARKPIGYIAKYASKGTKYDPSQKPFPKNCRIQGSGGLDKPMLDWKNWILCPSWLKELLGNEQFSVRKKMSYWVVEKLYCYSSPWFYDFIQRKITWRGYQPIREHSDVFPSVHISDHYFGSDHQKFKAAEPKYILENRHAVYRFIDAVNAIKFVGHLDAIDRAMSAIASR